MSRAMRLQPRITLGLHAKVKTSPDLRGFQPPSTDGEVGLCDDALQHADMRSVAGDEAFVGEEEDAVPQVRVEVACEVLRVRDRQPVLTNDVQ